MSGEEGKRIICETCQRMMRMEGDLVSERITWTGTGERNMRMKKRVIKCGELHHIPPRNSPDQLCRMSLYQSSRYVAIVSSDTGMCGGGGVGKNEHALGLFRPPLCSISLCMGFTDSVKKNKKIKIIVCQRF
jgi:hypothetical protein